jgi:hypothetical protein
MKRAIHLFHRWAGIALCAIFALWFLSGIFMMYVEFPQLTREERIAAAPELDFTTARRSPAAAFFSLHARDFARQGTPTANLPLLTAEPSAPPKVEEVRLATILGRPAYVFTVAKAQPVTVFADTGEKLETVSPSVAAQAAAAFAPGRQPRYLRTIQSDQWAVSAALNPHRPLHLFALDDEAGTQLYVSSVTGEVVRDSSCVERRLNYLAAVSHWLYPHFIRQYPEFWAWMIDILGAAGSLLALSGLWIGVQRARRSWPAVRSWGQRLLRWHFLAGAVFGIAALTFVFSGWMSMNPGKLNPPRTPSTGQLEVLAGRPFRPADFNDVPDIPPGTVEAALGLYDSQLLVVATRRDGTVALAPATHGETVRLPSRSALESRAAALRPGIPLAGIDWLESYDNYYYTRHPERTYQPLPIMRVRFADTAGTWFHIDPTTGQIVNRSTSTNRLFRHLYNGLHCLDWWWLWSHRPLWDIAVIGLSLGGLALSLSGVVLGLRRLRRPAVSS